MENWTRDSGLNGGKPSQGMIPGRKGDGLKAQYTGGFGRIGSRTREHRVGREPLMAGIPARSSKGIGGAGKNLSGSLSSFCPYLNLTCYNSFRVAQKRPWDSARPESRSAKPRGFRRQ